jgi:hypothetical protein
MSLHFKNAFIYCRYANNGLKGRANLEYLGVVGSIILKSIL